jgi:hypothetical protein
MILPSLFDFRISWHLHSLHIVWTIFFLVGTVAEVAVLADLRDSRSRSCWVESRRSDGGSEPPRPQGPL